MRCLMGCMAGLWCLSATGQTPADPDQFCGARAVQILLTRADRPVELVDLIRQIHRDPETGAAALDRPASLADLQRVLRIYGVDAVPVQVDPMHDIPVDRPCIAHLLPTDAASTGHFVVVLQRTAAGDWLVEEGLAVRRRWGPAEWSRRFSGHLLLVNPVGPVEVSEFLAGVKHGPRSLWIFQALAGTVLAGVLWNVWEHVRRKWRAVPSTEARR